MEQYTRGIRPTPPSLVSEGKFNNGTFSRPFKIINPLDADCYPLPLPRMIKNLRLKEWQAYQMANDKFFIFAVLYKAKAVGLAQFFVYDRQAKKKLLYEKIIPSHLIKLPASLSNSTGYYSAGNYLIEYHNNIDNNRLDLRIRIHNHGQDLPDIDAEFCGLYDCHKWEPIVVALPFSQRRSMYSHKCLMPMAGTLSIGDQQVVFDPNESCLIIDDHKGYYPFVTAYDWVTGIQYSGQQPLTGFNLTANQVMQPELYNENCLWLGGQVHPLPPVAFTRPHGVDNEWLIRDDYGMVDITFIPEAQGKIDMNLFIIKSYYRGPLGKFYGFIKDSSGTKNMVDDYFGMGEQKRVRL